MTEQPGAFLRAVLSGASAVARYFSEVSAAGRPPAVAISLTLLRPDGLSDDDVLLAVRHAVALQVASDLRLLGLPGDPDVSVGVDAREPGSEHADDSGGRERVRAEEYVLHVNGHRVRCAHDEIADIVTADADGTAVALSETPAAVLPAVAADLCGAALRRRLSVLLSDAGATRLLEQLDVPDERRPDVAEALRTVVDHGVSLTDLEAVAAVIDRTPAARISVAEALIDELRSTTLGLLFAPGTLRAATLEQPDERDLFTDMRTRLFADLGILAPDCRMLIDDTVPEGRVLFRLNDVPMRSWAVPRQQPLTSICARLEDVIRRHAAWFVSVSVLTEHTMSIGQALPDTVRCAEDRCPPEWQSALARALLDEQMSVRHIPTLLDRLLDLEPYPPGPGVVRLQEGPTPVQQVGSIGRLPSPRDAVSLLRQRQNEGTARMQEGASPLVHHALDVVREEELAGLMSGGDAATGDDVLERVAADVRRWHPDATTVPLVVRSRSVRGWLHDRLRAEFPDLRIYAAQEIPPGIATGGSRGSGS